MQQCKALDVCSEPCRSFCCSAWALLPWSRAAIRRVAVVARCAVTGRHAGTPVSRRAQRAVHPEDAPVTGSLEGERVAAVQKLLRRSVRKRAPRKVPVAIPLVFPCLPRRARFRRASRSRETSTTGETRWCPLSAASARKDGIGPLGPSPNARLWRAASRLYTIGSPSMDPTEPRWPYPVAVPPSARVVRSRHPCRCLHCADSFTLALAAPGRVDRRAYQQACARKRRAILERRRTAPLAVWANEAVGCCQEIVGGPRQASLYRHSNVGN